jgi:hypothetical protein
MSDSSSPRKRKREVKVVTCPFAFPISTKKKREPDPARPLYQQQDASSDKFLDFFDTAREVHALGATTFAGKQKRTYNDAQYKILTGREKKKHQVPLPIVRGIKKKAVEREARAAQSAKEAGIVLPTKKKQGKSKQAKMDKTTARVHGPAPSIGHLNKGVFKFKDKKEERGFKK